MSKVNRRKEIKEKEAFQLKFQLALNESSSLVAGWLPKDSSRQTNEASDHDFLNLPILSGGKGLFELENDEEEQKTVGDFVNPEKDPQKLKLQESRQNQAGSKAMSALINKLRNDSRGKVANKERSSASGKVQKKRSHFLGELKKQLPEKEKKQSEKEKPATSRSRDEVDSEDEEEQQQRAQRSTKKATKLSKRPF